MICEGIIYKLLYNVSCYYYTEISHTESVTQLSFKFWYFFLIFSNPFISHSVTPIPNITYVQLPTEHHKGSSTNWKFSIPNKFNQLYMKLLPRSDPSPIFPILLATVYSRRILLTLHFNSLPISKTNANSFDFSSDSAFTFTYLPPCTKSILYFSTSSFLIWISKTTFCLVSIKHLFQIFSQISKRFL